MSTRFRADRDLVVAIRLPGFYEDPMAEADGTTTKMGIDLTAPGGWPSNIKQRRTNPPQIVGNGTRAVCATCWRAARNTSSISCGRPEAATGANWRSRSVSFPPREN